MEDTKDPLHQALVLLGEILDVRDTSPVELVVCGGAALRALGLVNRATKDVDVLARRGEIDREIISGWPLPNFLREAVEEIALERRLPWNWLNASAGMLGVAPEHLPASVWSGLVERDYGSRLRVGYVDRKGLLFLKAHAAIDRDEKRDLSDLRAIAPTPAEWREVLEWLMRQSLLDDSKRARWKHVSNHLGMEVNHD